MLEVNADNFKEVVLQSQIPVVVDFWAPFCVPCKKMESIILELSVKLRNQIKFVKVNIEKNANLARSYMVMSIPTLIVFKDSVPCEKKIGTLGQTTLEKFIYPYSQ